MHFQSLGLIIIFTTLIRGEGVNEKNNLVNIFELFQSKPLWVPPNGKLLPTNQGRAMREIKKCGEGQMKGIQICVPYNRCHPETHEIIPEDAEFIESRHFIMEETECAEILHKCCTIPEKDRMISSTTITTVSRETESRTTESSTTESSTTESSTTESSTTESTTTKSTSPRPTSRIRTAKPFGLELSYCGIRNCQGLDTSIDIRSDEAQYGEFPWMVMIFKTDLEANESPSVCGGSLISPAVILTAAHCVQEYVDNFNKIRVPAGEWDILSERELYPKQDRHVSKIIIHPNFNKINAENDFALIFLQNRFTRAENVGTVCLPLYNQVIYSKNCFTGGWGRENLETYSAYSNILKKIKLPIVSNDICQKELRKTALGQNFILPDTSICAKDYGKNACKGDDGAPLVCPDPNNPKRYVQVGIMSWGVGCFEAPGVYADVATARHWIDGVMADEGYTPIPYSY